MFSTALIRKAFDRDSGNNKQAAMYVRSRQA